MKRSPIVAYDLLRSLQDSRGVTNRRQYLFRRVEKYRPATLDDLVSHKDITSTSTFLFYTLQAVTMRFLWIRIFAR